MPVRADRLAEAGIGLLLHRGPDGHGVIGNANSAVAMCRLRLRSRPGDTVPFTGAPKSAAYAFNGEIYAVGKGCWAGMDAGGGRVPTGGLAEGQAVAEHDCSALDGMYALLRWAPNGTIEVFRDPFGIKPLYLRRYRHGVTVASEIPALLDLHGPAQIRPEAVAQFLLFGRVVDGGTFFRDIHPVPPGARLLLKEGRVHWLAPSPGASRADTDHGPASAEDLRASVSLSVDRVLVSDRPLGLALSGGLDSTILASELARRGVTDLSTISVVPVGNGDGITSLPALKLPGTAWRSWRHRWITFGPQDLLDGVADAVRILGEPTAMTSVPMYAALSRLARESGIVALLLGEGADELFGGYRSYLSLTATIDPAAFYLSPGRREWVCGLLGEEACNAAAEALRAALPSAPGRPADETVREFEYEHSLEPLLRRADHLLMAQGVEGRTPFLHGGLPVLAASLPFAALVDRGQTKLMLRNAYAAELPAFAGEVKKPFRAPVNDWLTGSASVRVRSGVSGHRDRLAAVGVGPDGLGMLLERLRHGDSGALDLVFPLLALGSWLEWLDAGAGTRRLTVLEAKDQGSLERAVTS